MSYTREETANAILNMILEIPPSNEDLGKILEAVEDIACQTNLLAISLASKQVASENILPDMR